MVESNSIIDEGLDKKEFHFDIPISKLKPGNAVDMYIKHDTFAKAFGTGHVDLIRPETVKFSTGPSPHRVAVSMINGKKTNEDGLSIPDEVPIIGSSTHFHPATGSVYTAHHISKPNESHSTDYMPIVGEDHLAEQGEYERSIKKASWESEGTRASDIDLGIKVHKMMDEDKNKVLETRYIVHGVDEKAEGRTPALFRLLQKAESNPTFFGGAYHGKKGKVTTTSGSMAYNLSEDHFKSMRNQMKDVFDVKSQFGRESKEGSNPGGLGIHATLVHEDITAPKTTIPLTVTFTRTPIDLTKGGFDTRNIKKDKKITTEHVSGTKQGKIKAVAPIDPAIAGIIGSGFEDKVKNNVELAKRIVSEDWKPDNV